MKIIFLTRKFYPNIGGVERHVLEVSRELIRMGHEVSVVCEGSGKEELKGINIYRIPISVGEKLKKFQIWYWLFKNLDIIRKADIVHCHDVFFWIIPFRFLFPFKKIFLTFHGWEGVFPPRKKTIILRKLSEKLANGNICVGDYIKKWYGTRSDYVLYGGVEKTQNSKLKVKNKNIKLKIIFIGRLEKDTGLPSYLRILDKLYILNIKFHIVFLGDGSLKKQAEKYGKVLGFMEDPQKYITSTKFVFTSGYLSILEAMLNKKLVFSVFDNPLKEDYLIMSRMVKFMEVGEEPEKLVEKIKYYLSHSEEEKRLIEDAYEFAKEQTWEKVADTYIKLWQK